MKKKLKYIINENNFNNEDTILIIRTFLSKVKRLLKINHEMDANKDLDSVLSYFKAYILERKDIVNNKLKIIQEKH